MDAREWLDYIADGKLSSVWALSEKLAWEKAQSEVVSCREEFSQLLDRLSGTSNRLGRGLRCVCCAIAQGCRLGAIEVVSENAPILLAWEKATKEMERFRSFQDRSLWYESYGFVESSPQTEHLRTESRALELYSSLEAIPLTDELKEVFVPVYEAVTFIAEQEQYRPLLPTPLLEALQYDESPADEAEQQASNTKEQSASCRDGHGLYSIVLQMREEGKKDEEIAKHLKSSGLSIPQIGALLHTNPYVSNSERVKYVQRLLGVS